MIKNIMFWGCFPAEVERLVDCHTQLGWSEIEVPDSQTSAFRAKIFVSKEPKHTPSREWLKGMKVCVFEMAESKPRQKMWGDVEIVVH